MAISEHEPTTAVVDLTAFETVSIARQVLRREVNNRIRARHNGYQEEFGIFCECGQAVCQGGATVTPDLYDRLRRVPTHFLIAHGHRGPSERVLESHAKFEVIEKFGGGGREAIRFTRALYDGAASLDVVC